MVLKWPKAFLNELNGQSEQREPRMAFNPSEHDTELYEPEVDEKHVYTRVEGRGEYARIKQLTLDGLEKALAMVTQELDSGDKKDRNRAIYQMAHLANSAGRFIPIATVSERIEFSVCLSQKELDKIKADFDFMGSDKSASEKLSLYFTVIEQYRLSIAPVLLALIAKLTDSFATGSFVDKDALSVLMKLADFCLPKRESLTKLAEIAE